MGLQPIESKLWVDACCSKNLAAAPYRMTHAVLKKGDTNFSIKNKTSYFLTQFFLLEFFLAQAHAQARAWQACAQSLQVCNKYSDIRIYLNIFEQIYSFNKYSLTFLATNIFGHSFAEYLGQRIYSDIHSPSSYLTNIFKLI